MLNPASRSWRRWGMPRMDPVPTAPAPPTWNVLLAEMPPTESVRSARRKCSGSAGRGRPGRPQKGGAQSDSQDSPSRAASRHMSSTLLQERACRNHDGNENEKSSPAIRPSGVCERNVTRSSMTPWRVRPLRSETSSPSMTCADQIRVDAPFRAPDQSTATTSISCRSGIQRAASSQSLATVFQFRVVLTTPSRRSNMVPLSLEFP